MLTFTFIVKFKSILTGQASCSICTASWTSLDLSYFSTLSTSIYCSWSISIPFSTFSTNIIERIIYIIFIWKLIAILNLVLTNFMIRGWNHSVSACITIKVPIIHVVSTLTTIFNPKASILTWNAKITNYKVSHLAYRAFSIVSTLRYSTTIGKVIDTFSSIMISN